MTPFGSVPPVLAVGPFTLRASAPADLPDLAALTASDAMRRFLGSAPPTMAEHFARLLRNAGSWALYGYGVFTARDEHGALVGTAGVIHSLRGIGPDADDRPEAGWVIAESLWGQGVATRLMTGVLDWFDRAHGPRDIMACIEVGHDASDRVAAKLGFRPVRAFAFPPEGTPATLYVRPAAIAASTARMASIPST